jgi:hypothetical protein
MGKSWHFIKPQNQNKNTKLKSYNKLKPKSKNNQVASHKAFSL